MTRVETERGAARIAGVAAPDVTVELVHSEAEAREAVRVLAQVWPRDDGKEPLPPELAWVFAHSGNYVAVAREGGDLVGAAIGFRGVDATGAFLHSHIAGVLPDRQGASIGFTLKQHQRRWALDQGLDRVTWTFDPLVARNAYFNVVKLGATLTHYYVDFYGPMDDAINTGDETDRCLVSWQLAAAPAEAAATGSFTPFDIASVRAGGAEEVLTIDSRGEPVLRRGSRDLRLLQVPADVVALRHQEPRLAGAWRHALRQALTAAFDDGLEVVSVTRDCWYVVSRTP